MASEDASDGAETPRVRRHSLRQATVILPQTGERSHQRVTLRGDRNTFAGGRVNEQTPLLRSVDGHSDEHSDTSNTTPSRQWLHTKSAAIQEFVVSRKGKNVLKSSLAYLLASSAVFIPGLAKMLGSGDGKHLVANIIVWYNPARSFGSMTQGTMFATMAFVFSATVSYASMGTATLFERVNLLPLGHFIVLALFCGGSLGLMSWVKQRLGDPLVNVSVSLASIPIINMVTKEPAIRQGYISHTVIEQTLRMAILAIAISTLVNILVWPIAARQDLRANPAKANSALAAVLASTTAAFLSGNEADMESPDKMGGAVDDLSKNLAEARNEYYVVGLERQYGIEQRLVQCIQRLSQDIGGLTSAAATQFALLAETTASVDNLHMDEPGSSTNELSVNTAIPDGKLVRSISEPAKEEVAASPRIIEQQPLTSPPQTNSMRSVITMIRRTTSPDDIRAETSPILGADLTRHVSAPQTYTAESAAQIFETFVEQLGPPMKSLAFTLQQILVKLPFGPAPDYVVTNNPVFRTSLRDALALFTSSRKEALAAIYRSKKLTLARSFWVAADFEEVAASCGHFTSSLQDLAENVLQYLDVLDELEEEMIERSRGRSWLWLLFWRQRRDSLEEEYTAQSVLSSCPQSIAREVEPLPKTLSDIPSRSMKHPPTDTPDGKMPLRYRIWKRLSFMRRDDIRFAVKVGAGGAFFAMFAYIEPTKALFAHWRLEWSLTTYMFVCSMTIGAANTVTYKRLIGTSIGALLALVVWIVSDDNAYSLALLGWLVSMGCFYIMIVLNEGPMARFILLTYNLSVLYSYSLSINDEDGDEDEGGINPAIFEIVLHRLMAISIGCIYGLMVTRLVWPISSRKKLKSGLSLLWLRMALIWKRRPLSLMTDHDIPPSYMDIREEFRLREFATLLGTMRKNAESEYSLRRPFQSATFSNILKSTGRMLDSIHALNVAITKNLKATPGELAILQHTRQEREQLAKRISHLLSVLAASIKLEYPLTDALPEIEHARDRLLARLFSFRQDTHAADADDEDYEVLYVYALVTGQLAKEVTVTAREMEKLYGVLDERVLHLQ